MTTSNVDNNVAINEPNEKNNMMLSKSKSDSCVKYSDRRIKRIIEQNIYIEDTYPSLNKQHQNKRTNNNNIKPSSTKELNDSSLYKSVSCKY